MIHYIYPAGSIKLLVKEKAPCFGDTESYGKHFRNLDIVFIIQQILVTLVTTKVALTNYMFLTFPQMMLESNIILTK